MYSLLSQLSFSFYCKVHWHSKIFSPLDYIVLLHSGKQIAYRNGGNGMPQEKDWILATVESNFTIWLLIMIVHLSIRRVLKSMINSTNLPQDKVAQFVYEHGWNIETGGSLVWHLPTKERRRKAFKGGDVK